MMGQASGMMGGVGGWMAGMTLFGALVSALVIVVLSLSAVWLYQQVRQGARG